MNNSTQIRVMASPSNQVLQLALFCAKEGLAESNPGLVIYEGVVTMREYVDHFSCEKNSGKSDDETTIDEYEKMQRDATLKDPRVKSIFAYLRKGAGILPSATVFINKLTINENVQVGNRDMVIATLEADADRLIGDGQGRRLAAELMFNSLDGEELEAFAKQTISVKFVVTNTPTVYDSKRIVRQAFSNYHLQLKKPSTSISLFFDSSTPYGLLMNELLTCEVCGHPLQYWISVKGKISGSQSWTLVQFANFVHTSLGKTKGTLNKELDDPNCYQSTLEMLQGVIPLVLNKLPLSMLEGANSKAVHSNALFTKALFFTGLGYLTRSVLEDMLVSNTFNAEVFDKLADLPLHDLTSKDFIDAKITDEEGKIIPKSEKRIGSYLCKKLRVIHCEALTA